VTVVEFAGPSESTGNMLAERIAGDVTRIDSASAVDVIAVVDISPNSAVPDRASATVEIAVPSERLDDPGRARIAHRTAGGWTLRDAAVRDVSGGTVTLTVAVDSFSVFAVVERSPPSGPSATGTSTRITTDRAPESDAERTPADGARTPNPPNAVETSQSPSTATEPGGFGVPILVLILGLLTVVAAAVAILRRREGL
jgi:hypothetical protein